MGGMLADSELICQYPLLSKSTGVEMSDTAEPIIWNDIKIEYVGPLSLDFALDSKDRNAVIKLTNVGDVPIEDIYFQIAIEGVGDYPATTGNGGFAVFPNGGNIDLAPGESLFAQNKLAGVYESRFGNSPPGSGETKVYSFDFIISLFTFKSITLAYCIIFRI